MVYYSRDKVLDKFALCKIFIEEERRRELSERQRAKVFEDRVVDGLPLRRLEDNVRVWSKGQQGPRVFGLSGSSVRNKKRVMDELRGRWM